MKLLLLVLFSINCLKHRNNTSSSLRKSNPLRTVYLQMSGDRLFVNDIQKAVRLQASKVNSPIHYYYFTYRGAHSSSEWLRQSNENLGACHGDDAILILSGVLDTQSTEQDRRMSKTLIDIWISFAKNGLEIVTFV